MKLNEQEITALLQSLTDIGISLSAEKDHDKLLEMILKKAMEITHADGGSIYTVTENRALKFEIMINLSMKIHIGGSSKNKAHFPDLPLYNDKGQPNKNMLAPWAAISKKTIVIKDAYTNKRFDLSGTKQFDKASGYHSKSFITIPMTNHLDKVIGVLQLINATDPKTGTVKSFRNLDRYLVESLASQAAVTITNRELIEAQKALFNSLIQLIAKAIDEKSPYTGNHCRRVPIITQMIAEAACASSERPWKKFNMSEDEIYELNVAAWLHDCGKITTPEAVVDKATKLEGIRDGIELIDTRFEVLKRDAVIDYLKAQSGTTIQLEAAKELQAKLKSLDEQREFIRKCNVGGEQMQPEHIEAIEQIGQQMWKGPSGKKEALINEKEQKFLQIYRGTLTDEERKIINNHVSVSIKMLESLPYPDNLKNVPVYAGGHHEKVDGTGYPKGLTKEQMPIQARMIALADIFEALTSSERPYKKALPLAQVLTIMGRMSQEGHIDPDLFKLFIDAKIYQTFAENYLTKDALKDIDLKKIPGLESS